MKAVDLRGNINALDTLICVDKKGMETMSIDAYINLFPFSRYELVDEVDHGIRFNAREKMVTVDMTVITWYRDHAWKNVQEIQMPDREALRSSYYRNPEWFKDMVFNSFRVLNDWIYDMKGYESVIYKFTRSTERIRLNMKQTARRKKF